MIYVQRNGRSCQIRTKAFGVETVKQINADTVASVRVSGIQEGTVEGEETPYLTITYRFKGRPKTVTSFEQKEIEMVKAMQLEEGEFVNIQLLPRAAVFTDNDGSQQPPRLATLVAIERGEAAVTEIR